jgi:hypothetical protein
MYGVAAVKASVKSAKASKYGTELTATPKQNVKLWQIINSELQGILMEAVEANEEIRWRLFGEAEEMEIYSNCYG